MKIAVHHEDNTPKSSFTYKWIDILEGMDIMVDRINMKNVSSLDKFRQYDGLMWHWYHTSDEKQMAIKIITALELNMKMPVFPNLNTCWHFDEKIAQYYLLKSLDAPFIPTKIFWEKEAANMYLKESHYPIVFKLSVGAGAANVIKINDYHQARYYLNMMFGEGIWPYEMNEFKKNDKYLFKKMSRRLTGSLLYLLFNKYPSAPQYYNLQKNYFYLQKYINCDHDIRITVIGNKALCFKRNNRDNDFRASGSGKIIYDGRSPEIIKAKDIAFNVSKKCRFQCMAYDFICDDKDGPLISEISYGFNSNVASKCQGYWTYQGDWIEEPIIPEKIQAEEFVKEITNWKYH